MFILNNKLIMSIPATIEQLNYYDQYISPTPIQHRISLFQDLISDKDKEVYFRLMNWNLDIIKHFTNNGNKKFKRPSHKEILWAIPGCFY
jgi:hypothetical protein